MFSTWSEEPVAAVIDSDPRGGRAVRAPRCPTFRPIWSGAINVAAEAADATLLVILDQFEELFLYHPTEPGGGGNFATATRRCVNDPSVRAHFLISIREDAYAGIGDLLNGLIPNVYGNYLHLDYLDRAAARDAIVRPIDRVNEQLPDEPSRRDRGRAGRCRARPGASGSVAAGDAQVRTPPGRRVRPGSRPPICSS